ncbi:MAG: hypothetical protein ABFQ89_01560, partial [Chloroflexota bacterium]
MEFPLLPIITLTPAFAAVIIMLIPQDRKTEVRVVAAAAALLTMVLSIFAYFGYDIEAANQATAWADKLQYTFGPFPWLESIGISFYMGADGLS